MSTLFQISLAKQTAILLRMTELGILEKDIEEQFVRGSGAGGQKRNKTSNCVKLKHTPTGISVRFGMYRERSINQILARRELCEKIEQQRLGKLSAKEIEIAKIRKQKKRQVRKQQHAAKENRVAIILKKFPLLDAVLVFLNKNTIPYLIGGSACLYLLGNDRLPGDIDIYLRDEDHDRADQLFGITSFEYVSPLEIVRNSNPYGEHALQLTSHLRISLAQQTFDLSLHQEMLDQSKVLKKNGHELRLLPPEDVVLIKALLQRGVEVGKYDVEDIQRIKNIVSLDQSYLQRRLAYLQAEKRVGGLLK